MLPIAGAASDETGMPRRVKSDLLSHENGPAVAPWARTTPKFVNGARCGNVRICTDNML